MTQVSPYRPKLRTDPQVLQLLWRGIYYGIAVGLLVGAGVWGFLLLGGAPVAADQTRAVLTLAAGGLLGAAAVCSSIWGARGLQAVGTDLVEAVAYRLEWFLWPFIPESERYDREQRVEAASQAVARAILAAPAGVPVMVALLSSRKIRPLALLPLGMLTALGAAIWILVLVTGWHWAITPNIAPPQPPAVNQALARARAGRESAQLDSALQLAVARAKRAKADGDNPRATQILEQALRDAEAQGRSVAHLQLHWLLAWLYADRGDIHGAMTMFRTVLDLAEPDSEMAEEADAALRRLAKKATREAQGAETPTVILEEDSLSSSEPAQ